MLTEMLIKASDLERATRDDRWLGFGYLGERRNTLARQTPDAALLVEAVDQRVADWANSHGWTYDDLFSWANSRTGRYFGDVVFGGGQLDRNFADAVRWQLLALPR
jgi:hypothetical protein